LRVNPGVWQEGLGGCMRGSKRGRSHTPVNGGVSGTLTRDLDPDAVAPPTRLAALLASAAPSVCHTSNMAAASVAAAAPFTAAAAADDEGSSGLPDSPELEALATVADSAARADPDIEVVSPPPRPRRRRQLTSLQARVVERAILHAGADARPEEVLAYLRARARDDVHCRNVLRLPDSFLLRSISVRQTRWLVHNGPFQRSSGGPSLPLPPPPPPIVAPRGAPLVVPFAPAPLVTWDGLLPLFELCHDWLPEVHHPFVVHRAEHIRPNTLALINTRVWQDASLLAGLEERLQRRRAELARITPAQADQLRTLHGGLDECLRSLGHVRNAIAAHVSSE
jgi:hypothetical protein